MRATAPPAGATPTHVLQPNGDANQSLRNQGEGGRAEPFSYERSPGGHDVVVRITHCSVARGDIQFIDDDWGDARFPLVPGHEIVGIVEEAGSEVTDLHLGDRGWVSAISNRLVSSAPSAGRASSNSAPARRSLPSTRMEVGRIESSSLWTVRVQAPAQLDSARSTPLLSSGLTVFAGIRRVRPSTTLAAAVLGAGGLGQLVRRRDVLMGLVLEDRQ